MADLVVQAPDGSERTFPLGEKPVSVGRSEECDVVIPEGKASRRHCTFRPHKGGWRVVDEGSSNGTWLGGKPVLAARLKPGDEVEIGETVITFVAERGEVAAPRAPRRRAPPPPKPAAPWGMLVVPVLAAAAAFFVVRSTDRAESATAARKLEEYAAACVELAKLRATPEERSSLLAEARREIETRPDAASALAALDAAIAGPVEEPGRPAKPADDWRAALAAVEADRSASAAQRRARLRELLERHLDDPDAVVALRRLLGIELASVGERERADRERTFERAELAATEGRFGEAVELWTGWAARAPAVSPEDDEAIASRLSSIADKARAAATDAAERFDRARREGREAAAKADLDAAVERLRGTGFDVWLAARAGGRPAPGGRTPVVPVPGPEKPDDASTRERTAAIQARNAAEEVARRRRFADAAAQLEQAAGRISDAALKADVAGRAGDLRSEAAFVAKLLAQVAGDPKRFSPLQLDGRACRVEGASADEVRVLDKEGRPESHPLESLPSAALVQFAEKAALDAADWIGAALLFHDLGERDAYAAWMRLALGAEDLRLAASEVHARTLGAAMPPAGFMPHPKDAKAIVTYDEWKAIKNEAKIAELRTALGKVVEKVEASKQAKAVDSVRKAYVKLEETRRHALVLIFDEKTYFYPYRDRMREYVPVQRDVDERVKAVREAWADPAAAKVRGDAALEKLLAEAEKTVTDIQFYGGDPADLVARVDAVRMYLGSDLTVQTFFESRADRDLMAYNAKVLKHNDTVKGPTEPERRQVEVTNEYRIMFGHRRALRIHPMLVQSARGHSDDMGKVGFFDHFSPVPGKRTPEDRIKLAGYQPAGCSENIHAGSGSPEGAHDGWIHSSGHHRNILGPGWVEMGTGQSGRFWTQNFAFRLDDDWDGGTPK